MKFVNQKIDGLYLIIPSLHQDERGVFRRSFCEDEFASHGITFNVKQGNISENFKKHTLRGFHYQISPSKESKIISCITGSLFNVVIDLREGSKTYHEWNSLEISSNKKESIIVPPNCANAILTLRDNTILHYYMSDYFEVKKYSGLRYNDPSLKIKWPIKPKIINQRDKNYPDYNF